jgi:hypothetical protein
VTATSAPPRRLWRSTGAVLAGFIAIVVVSLGRIVYGVLGS